jgi:hypothetical protein
MRTETQIMVGTGVTGMDDSLISGIFESSSAFKLSGYLNILKKLYLYYLII